MLWVQTILVQESSAAVCAFVENLCAKNFPGQVTIYGDYIVHASWNYTKFVYWSARSEWTLELNIFAPFFADNFPEFVTPLTHFMKLYFSDIFFLLNQDRRILNRNSFIREDAAFCFSVCSSISCPATWFSLAVRYGWPFLQNYDRVYAGFSSA